VPYVELTASLDAATKRQVQRTMLLTAFAVALLLIALGEFLRALLHFSVASLSIAGGVILLIQAVSMVLAPPRTDGQVLADRDPVELARYPLAVPYLLNPVGNVGLVTISAEATSVLVLAVAVATLLLVLLIDMAVFRGANRVSATLDESRMLVTERVFGFLIAAIAVQLVLDGLADAGVIGHLPH
jgi:small neutral amino acid transporter SnatA (MarC family)